MQNSITFMGPFIVQNSQQTAARRSRDAHSPPPPFRRYSQVFGHFLEGKRPGKCQTWPQYNEDLWTCLGLFEPLPATSLCTANCSYYYVYYSLVGLATAAACLRATTMVENQKNSQWNTWEEAIAVEL